MVSYASVVVEEGHEVEAVFTPMLSFFFFLHFGLYALYFCQVCRFIQKLQKETELTVFSLEKKKAIYRILNLSFIRRV